MKGKQDGSHTGKVSAARDLSIYLSGHLPALPASCSEPIVHEPQETAARAAVVVSDIRDAPLRNG